MEYVITDAHVYDPEIGKGLKEEPGILFRSCKEPVGHDPDRELPPACLPDAFDKERVEQEWFPSLEVNGIDGTRILCLVQHPIDLTGVKRTLCVRTTAYKAMFARECTHVRQDEMDLGDHGAPLFMVIFIGYFGFKKIFVGTMWDQSNGCT